MWLIYGSHGWIGSQFIKLLKQQHILYLDGTSRIDDEKAIEEELRKINPDRVISFTGRTQGNGITSIDYLEGGIQQNLENVRDNLFGPIVLATICKRLNIHFTYLGTGCIFTYDDDHPLESTIGFIESDKPNFFGSSYSVVKGFTDRLFHLDEYQNFVLNVRIRMPITNNLRCTKNFIAKIIKYEKICSIQNSMTVLPDLLPVLIQMIQKKKTGSINLTNPGTISHNEILDLYKQYINPYFIYTNFTQEEQRNTLKSERSNNMLDTTLLESEYPNVPGIYTSIENLFKRLYELV